MNKLISFSTQTLVRLIDSGRMEVPPRYWRWSKTKATGFIDSIMSHYPTREILTTSEPDGYKVLDGVNRVLTIYYFSKNRFPKIFVPKANLLDEDFLNNNEYFEDFLYEGKSIKQFSTEELQSFYFFQLRSLHVDPNLVDLLK